MSGIKGPDRAPEEKLAQWIRDYQAALLRSCYLYLQDRGLAEDAVQETYLKAYQHWADFRAESSEKTWLFRIAINTCRDMRRSAWFRHRDRRLTPDMLPGAQASFAPRDERLTLLVANLPRKLKEVVLLYYYQVFSVTEIAQALSISQSSVSGRLKRAREALRRGMGGVYGEE